MQKKAISWILDFTDKLPNDEERIKCLRANAGPAMKIVLRCAFRDDITFLLPEGVPEYEENQVDGNDQFLYREARKFEHFINPEIHPIKRENIFISLLQSVSPEDAKLICAVKDKNLPYENITKDLVTKAFPEDFNE